MPSFSLRRFSEPESLKAIDPSILVTFLRPFTDYLRRRAFYLPNTPNDSIDYKNLCRVLLNPDESVPRDMVDALYYVHELSDEEGMDALLDFLDEHRMAVEIGPDPAPADVAMLVWLKDPDVLRRQHAKGYAFRPHRFEHYRSRTSGIAPSGDDGLLIPLQDHLDEWFEKRKRGRGCQVFTFESADRLWIVIRHGEPYKREGSIRSGKSASEYFRPEKYDVLIYETSTGTIAVNAKGVRLINQYLYTIGVFFFGNGEFFPLKQDVTLTPLIKYGADSLNFEEFPDIEEGLSRCPRFGWIRAGHPVMIRPRGHEATHSPRISAAISGRSGVRGAPVYDAVAGRLRVPRMRRGAVLPAEKSGLYL